MLKIHIKVQDYGVTGIFDDIDLMLYLRKELKLFPVAVGSLSHSLQNKILGPPFILNSLQMQYLYEFGKIEYNPEVSSVKYRVFKHFTNLRYIVKDGFKYGSDFLVYSGDPVYCHAEAMVIIGSVISRFRVVELCRIANDTNKNMLLAYERGGVIEVREIAWVNTGAR